MVKRIIILFTVLFLLTSCNKGHRFDFRFIENQSLYQGAVEEILRNTSETPESYSLSEIEQHSDTTSFKNTIKLFKEFKISLVSKRKQSVSFHYHYRYMFNNRKKVLIYNYNNPFMYDNFIYEIEKIYNDNWCEAK